MSTICAMTTAVQIAAIATPVLVLVGLIFAIQQLRAAHDARMVGIVLTLLQRWESVDMQRSKNAVRAYYGPQPLMEGVKAMDDLEQDVGELLSPLRFLNWLGVLVRRKFLSVAVAYDVFGNDERFFHAMYFDVMENWLRPSAFDGLIYLHSEFEKRRAASPERRSS